MSSLLPVAHGSSKISITVCSRKKPAKQSSSQRRNEPSLEEDSSCALQRASTGSETPTPRFQKKISMSTKESNEEVMGAGVFDIEEFVKDYQLQDGNNRKKPASRSSSLRRNEPPDEEGGSHALQHDSSDSEMQTPRFKQAVLALLKASSSYSIASRSSTTRKESNKEATEDYLLQDGNGSEATDDNDGCCSDHTLHHHLTCAPYSTIFCVLQCIILPIMMIQCGVAPLKINPMIGPYPDALNYWGAKNSVLIIEDGEAWRLFTPIFSHAGLIHLAGNVMVQIDSGNEWEKEWGSLIWMIIYIGSAFGSSVFSVCFMPDNISVGSSGAVMGLFGGKLSEILLLCCEKSTNAVEKSDERARKRQTCHVISGIVVVMAMSLIPFVDWAAHVGGMIAGIVLGLVCFSFKIQSRLYMFIWSVVGVGTTLSLFAILMDYMYTKVEANEELRDVCGYYREFFSGYECKCTLN